VTNYCNSSYSGNKSTITKKTLPVYEMLYKKIFKETSEISSNLLASIFKYTRDKAEGVKNRSKRNVAFQKETGGIVKLCEADKSNQNISTIPFELKILHTALLVAQVLSIPKLNEALLKYFEYLMLGLFHGVPSKALTKDKMSIDLTNIHTEPEVVEFLKFGLHFLNARMSNDTTRNIIFGDNLSLNTVAFVFSVLDEITKDRTTSLVTFMEKNSLIDSRGKYWTSK